MKKLWKIFLPLLLIILIAGGVYFYQQNKANSTAIALIPLDSRPCNTQYPQTLAQMAGMRLILPADALLDDFLTPADQEGLWQWLEQTAPQCDRIIISTNELLQGGLINSRSSDSYANLESDINRLQEFCQNHPEQKITILTILPRLLPSQYDSDLAGYMTELSQYGRAWDQADLNASPLPQSEVPAEILEKYRQVFLQCGELLKQLQQMAADGLCEVVIGQDDGEEYCPSNILKRQILANPTDNLTFVHGADELTMLILASFVDLPPSEVQIIIDDESAWSKYFPYEAADLTTILKEKLALANVTISEEAQDTIFIHADNLSSESAAGFIAGEGSAYRGLADIAYTNKGDKALADYLLSSANNLHAYSGWNTAGNTLGTIIAHYRLSQAFPQTKQAAQAAIEFKAIRLSEDLVYQALISNDLRLSLANQKLMNSSTTAFTADIELIEPLLAERFAPYKVQLEELFTSAQEILPQVSVDVTSAEINLSFPWNRAFEVKCESKFKLSY